MPLFWVDCSPQKLIRGCGWVFAAALAQLTPTSHARERAVRLSGTDAAAVTRASRANGVGDCESALDREAAIESDAPVFLALLIAGFA